MKVSTTVSENQITIQLESTDGTDKMIVSIIQGCTTAKVDVNGSITFTVDRPKRPLKFEPAVEADEKKERP